MFFWIILVLIVGALSFILAFRSMKNYKEVPKDKENFSNFLIRDKTHLDDQIIQQLHSFLKGKNTIAAFERLVKGEEDVTLLFGPASLVENFPTLDLFEVEDYLLTSGVDHPLAKANKVFVNQVSAWEVLPKKHTNLEIKEGFLKGLGLGENQRFFMQVILQPQEDKNNSQNYPFQATIRCMVVEDEPSRRVEVYKKLSSHIATFSNLETATKTHTNSHLFIDYSKRSFFPKEVSKFTLNSREILPFIK